MRARSTQPSLRSRARALRVHRQTFASWWASSWAPAYELVTGERPAERSPVTEATREPWPAPVPDAGRGSIGNLPAVPCRLLAKRLLLMALAVLVVPVMLVIPSAVLRAATAPGNLPPSARKQLVAIFDPKLERFGLRVTRAALLDWRHRPSAHGKNLAIYVEPTGVYTAQDYLDGAVD